MIIKNKKLTNAVLLFAVFGLLLTLQSCGLIEPKDASETANTPPETIITSGPLNNSNYSYHVRIAWKGEDVDGLVKSFNLGVDNPDPSSWVSVTITDSTFNFSADTTEEHTIWVAAVDEKGAVDPTPASVTFFAVSSAPETRIELDDNPEEGSMFGKAQKFYIIAEDPDNGPEFTYRYKIDENGQWSEWLDDSIVEFYEGSPFGLLPVGEHTFYAQVRDAALAIDLTPATFSFIVTENVRPDAVLTGSFNSHEFYSDNSAFYFVNDSNNVRFAWEVDASAYYGHYSAAKYKLDNNDWTGWLAIQDTLFAELTPGEHTFILKVKDTGGIESEEVTFTFNLVQPTFDAGILVVDDVNGRFAKDPDVDNFYSQVLTEVGVNFTSWDIRDQGVPTPGNGMGSYSTVIWQADESFMVQLPQQILLAEEYLDAGGNLWITGWKPIQQLTSITPVASFDPAAANDQAFTYTFLWEYLKLASTRQSPGSPPDFMGATGLEGHPDLNVDEAKNFIPTFGNKLTTIDMFTIRNVENTTAIYSFVSASGNPDFQDQITGAKYLGDDFKSVVFGFPFYFMKTDEAVAAARVILTDFGEI